MENEIISEPWGEVEGQAVTLYTLTNELGMTARITTYGAILNELIVPDNTGAPGDVVFGYDTVGEYVRDKSYFGATIGRVANRIARGRFTLGGKEYALAVNNGANHLHGGTVGWNKKVWDAVMHETLDGSALRLSLLSHDGDEGYPGTVQATVTYTVLRGANTLRIEYEAITDAPTLINLTNHSYFNLRGSGDILAHVVTLNADTYTPVDETLIPTGAIASVAGTPFDFLSAHSIGERIAETAGDPVGYDHNFVRRDAESFGLAAQVYEPTTGRMLAMSTTEPGFQFYTGNMMDETLAGKSSQVYVRRGAFCLEAQHFPDAVNQPGFAPIILCPGETYTQRTEYAFGIQ